MTKKEKEEIQKEDRWYEVFGLGRIGLSAINPDKMLSIPGHIFLKF